MKKILTIMFAFFAFFSVKGTEETVYTHNREVKEHFTIPLFVYPTFTKRGVEFNVGDVYKVEWTNDYDITIGSKNKYTITIEGDIKYYTSNSTAFIYGMNKTIPTNAPLSSKYVKSFEKIRKKYEHN